ncbi:transglycosylase SLT domain-containing protein [Nocardioides sp.]|uniref:lytic transglycosylase n=1 Tax=Nocardioides sp. TaxID=35761 RepID=UPI00286E120D|nr:transglycosylase SLT domain-containing protein [Nocardioides sp.]
MGTRRRTSTLIPTAVGLGVAVALVAVAPAAAEHEQLPGNRDLTTYIVEPGDTASGLSVRFHAWTAELISHNHLGPAGTLRVGQRLEIPVVTSRADDSGGEPGHDHDPTAEPGRERVRTVITRIAKHRGVDPQLALAVSWQEAGWQMHHVSSAGAVGAMQVLPSTARWMESYADRDLRLHSLRDNATAGVLLLDVLRDHTRSRRHQVGAYYQGIGAVQRHGLYDETVRYVDNVLAIKKRLERGDPPA